MRVHRKHQELLKKKKKDWLVQKKEKHITIGCNLSKHGLLLQKATAITQMRCLITCLADALQALPRVPGGISDFTSLSKGNPEPWPKSWQTRKGITNFPTICLLSVILSLHTCSANELTQLSSFFQRSSKKNQLSGSNGDTFLRKSGGGQWEAVIMLVAKVFSRIACYNLYYRTQSVQKIMS